MRLKEALEGAETPTLQPFLPLSGLSTEIPEEIWSSCHLVLSSCTLSSCAEDIVSVKTKPLKCEGKSAIV